jgi:hypothetical protein
LKEDIKTKNTTKNIIHAIQINTKRNNGFKSKHDLRGLRGNVAKKRKKFYPQDFGPDPPLIGITKLWHSETGNKKNNLDILAFPKSGRTLIFVHKHRILIVVLSYVTPY